MKLRSLTVQSFRAINGNANTIKFDGANIIFVFGQNDLGKSSFLRAYEYFVAPKKKASLSDFHKYDVRNPIIMEAVFDKEAGDDKNFQKKGFDKWVLEDNTIRFRKIWNQPDTEGQKETFSPEMGEYTKDGFGGLETYLTKAAPTPISIPAMPTPNDLEKWVTDVLKKKVLKSLSEDSAIAYQEAIDKLEILQSEIESRELIQGIALNANMSFQQVFPELELSISPEPGHKIDISKALEKEFNVAIQRSTCEEESSENNKSSFNSHGHGVIRQAMFNFLGLSENNISNTADENVSKEYIILFEEPELYLHPKRIRLLKDTLYQLCTNSKFQMLCVSHNPQLIDLSKPHTTLARIIKLGDGKTEIHQVGEDIFASNEEYRNKILMLNRFNPHLCETFFADEVILVEGDTEAIVLRELLNIHFPTRDIFVLNTGTKNNMPFFMDILTHFRIKHHIIHDSDCRYQYEKDGTVKRKKDGTPKANSSWTLNDTIWTKVLEANSIEKELCKRFVSVQNFEDAHGYSHDTTKGKPWSAYEYAQELNLESDASIVYFLKCIANNIKLENEFTPEYLENIVIERYQEVG
ncbi:hypothetical protein DSLASN_18520 [Desulfoluna limicola]|uniref:ATP-dependent endonuclease n=1 Tax=Desulfoluna limicola TaxID=2810562 RepID=A0ABN6F3R0_9BACT|nr:AAA family ATPase [Desulfoluna limicola]BCS96220.1 hypothetical protein DSLASN_18520 [Desulfoluna limicola]